METGTSFFDSIRLEFILPILILIGAVALFMYARRREKARGEGLLQQSYTLNLKFSDEAPNILPGITPAGFEQRESSRKAYNMLKGKHKGWDVSIFDYDYTIGIGKRQRSTWLNVACFKSEKLLLPPFFLMEKKRLEDAEVELGGTFTVEKMSDKSFTEKYGLYMLDKTGVLPLLNDKITRFLLQNDFAYVRGGFGVLWVYSSPFRVAPENMKDFLAKSTELAEMFAAAIRDDNHSGSLSSQ